MRLALYHNLCSGGAKRVAHEHCRALVAAGHQVVVYEPETADRSFNDLAEGPVIRPPCCGANLRLVCSGPSSGARA